MVRIECNLSSESVVWLRAISLQTMEEINITEKSGTGRKKREPNIILEDLD